MTNNKDALDPMNTNLIWIDLEMTGLCPETDLIIEIATLVTNQHLNLIAEGPSLVIHQSKERMDQMDEWCTKQHGKTGLTQRVIDSNISAAEAEQATLTFLKQHVNANKSPMCGNSICQDRRFLAKYMPELEAFFHYRHIDVSTIKELANRWKPEASKGFKKSGSHLAMDDIRDSVAELKHYRSTWLLPTAEA